VKPAIRRGSSADARAAADLYLRAREAGLRAGSIPAGVHDDDDVRGYFAAHIVGDCELWVAEADGVLVGILVLDGEFVDQLYVEPGLTGRGIGSALLALARRERPGGLRLWTFQSNTGAQRFYERNGFVEVRRTDGRDNEERAPDVLYEYRAAERSSFGADVPGGALAGWVGGEGAPVLLLHGGPGLSFDYLEGLAAELGPGYRVAAYQQRGLEPSTTEGPFEVAREVADALAVLDALGWERAWVVGHSWGGHLLLHLAAAHPRRLCGGLAVDPLGAVGDGGAEAFDAEIFARTSEEDRARAQELDGRALRGEGSEDDVREGLRLVWPAYFASRDRVMDFPDLRASVAAYAGLFESLTALMPDLQARLADVAVPMGFVTGAAGPMPADAASATAAAIPGAWVDVIDGAGHFPWFECPGSVRAALQRLVGAQAPS
jgi:pimeloyl-ACP methyl ester carboxylesterase